MPCAGLLLLLCCCCSTQLISTTASPFSLLPALLRVAVLLLPVLLRILLVLEAAGSETPLKNPLEILDLPPAAADAGDVAAVGLATLLVLLAVEGSVAAVGSPFASAALPAAVGVETATLSPLAAAGCAAVASVAVAAVVPLSAACTSARIPRSDAGSATLMAVCQIDRASCKQEADDCRETPLQLLPLGFR